MSDDRLDLLDYYTLLGVDEDAGTDAIRRAFHAFARKFHPDNHFGGAPEKLQRATQIFRRGAEAYRVLLDPELRDEYDRQLQRGQLRYRPEERRSTRPPSGALQIRSPKARPFATKAQQAMAKKDWKSARLNLKIALQHEPDNPLLTARLAEVEARLQKG